MKITKNTNSKLSEFRDLKPDFGTFFTDHMLICDYKNGLWSEPEIVPYDTWSLSPASQVFHYGQACFEGMKAYKDSDNDVFLFRPEKNFDRFNKSANRLCMPSITEEIFMGGLKKLVDIDREWVPKDGGSALYIRPFMVATESKIRAVPASEFRFAIICCPVYSYYSKPLKVKVEESFSRASSGGFGFAKAAGNYAGSFSPTEAVKKQGYDQILWMDSKNHEYVEESGTMNVFFRINDTLITPQISDTILNGVTRNSVIKIAESLGVEVQQRKISITEIVEAIKNKTLKEAFGCGTAVVVNPFEMLSYKGVDYDLNLDSDSSLYGKIKNILTDIQYNKSEDEFGWRVKI